MDVVGIGESRQNGKQCDDDEQEWVNRERLVSVNQKSNDNCFKIECDK